MSVLPNKYTPISYSLIGTASHIFESMNINDTISSLWDRVREDDRIRTFDRFADALALLFAGSMVTLDRGVLRRSSRQVAP
jgi:hypothetical protein